MPCFLDTDALGSIGKRPGFFMGMSKAGRYRVQISPGVVEKIRKMTKKKVLLKVWTGHTVAETGLLRNTGDRQDIPAAVFFRRSPPKPLFR